MLTIFKHHIWTERIRQEKISVNRNYLGVLRGSQILIWGFGIILARSSSLQFRISGDKIVPRPWTSSMEVISRSIIFYVVLSIIVYWLAVYVILTSRVYDSDPDEDDHDSEPYSDQDPVFGTKISRQIYTIVVTIVCYLISTTCSSKLWLKFSILKFLTVLCSRTLFSAVLAL